MVSMICSRYNWNIELVWDINVENITEKIEKDLSIRKSYHKGIDGKVYAHLGNT